MIDQTTAKEMISNLSDLSGYPEKKWLRRSYVKMLQEHAQSEAHAGQAITSALEHGNGFCPSIPELIAACKRTAKAVDPSVGCQVCQGLGYRVVRALSSVDGDSCRYQRLSPEQEQALLAKGFRPDTGNQQIVDAAVKCPACRGGS